MLEVHLIGGPVDGTSRRVKGGHSVTLTIINDQGAAEEHTYRFLIPCSADRVIAVHEDLNNGQAMRLLWEAYVKVHELGEAS